VPLSQGVDAAARELRLQLAEIGLGIGQRVALDRCGEPGKLRQGIGRADEALARLDEAIRANAGRDAEFDLLAPRLAALRTEIGRWMAALERRAAQDDGDDTEEEPSVRWIAATAHGAQFHATALAPGAAFARAREKQPQAWILTSATLTLAGSFAPFVAEIGLPDARTLRWDSPFDFGRQGLLYLPRPLPSPLRPDFPERVAEAAWPVIAAAGGRAFVLCSTLRAVERVAARLEQLRARDGLELTLLVQGASTRRALLDEFRRRGDAVLVGSVSFWEGIDVRGEALSVVAIDKLPFAPPDDPVVEARIRRLRSLGRNPFLDYQLPAAVTLLKQGVGRLIRDERDRGVLMILDERLLAKPYGRTVLASLPPFARTRDEDEALAFIAAPGDRG
jgi:ATP-dependent DNA helicase DinG